MLRILAISLLVACADASTATTAQADISDPFCRILQCAYGFWGNATCQAQCGADWVCNVDHLDFDFQTDPPTEREWFTCGSRQTPLVDGQ